MAYIADSLNTDSAWAKHAAILSKTDLVTEMVGEFPSLQGTMGRYYALADGEPAEVAAAIEEHYMPRQSGGELPRTHTGQILSLAEKLDTLTGIFSVGLVPSGDKDPYALRRAALGILRIIIERGLELDLGQLISFALQQLPHPLIKEGTAATVLEFVTERFRGYCLDRGYRHDEFDAVLSVGPSKPLDFEWRLIAVKQFRKLPAAACLASANKRIRNILRKSDSEINVEVERKQLIAPEEINLLEAADAATDELAPVLENHDYTTALTQLATMREPVDLFFDKVMVMSEDPVLRGNRLALLYRVESLFLKIADISKLQ